MPDRKPAPKYVLLSPDSEVNGAALMALEQSSELEEFADLLDKYNLRGIQPNVFYRMDNVVEYYKEVMQRPNASTNFVSMGINLFKTIKLPGDATTVAQGLQLLIQFTTMNMRGAPESADWYEVEEVGPHHVRLIERTPFPHDLIYGYVFGTVRRLAGDNSRPIVERIYMNPDDPDADGAIYDIKW